MKLPTATEMMIQALSREVRDGEITATGTLSPIPAAACYLAQLTHAPTARLLILASPDWPFDSELEEMFCLAQQGKMGLFFLSGAQIDRQANTNLVVIGPYERPKVRLPGGAGTAMICHQARRVALFMAKQTERSLVEKVDFITGPGGSPGPGRPGGPCRLVTDLAVFDYLAGQGLVLASIHPGVSLEEVQARTGFPLQLSGPVPQTPAPDEAALALIHGPVKEKLAKTYPSFAQQL